MSWVTIGTTAATLVGGAIASNKASSAADKAAKQNTKLTDQQKAQVQPWVTGGTQANSQLNMLMGLGTNDTYDSLYNQYKDQFTTYKKLPTKSSGGFVGSLFNKIADPLHLGADKLDPIGNAIGISPFNSSQKAGYKAIFGDGEQLKLDAFVKQKLAEQESTRSNPMYGYLTRNFTNDDFVKDPGYQFRMDEGIKGVDRSAAARGGLFSGQAAKELDRYSQGFASNEFNNAYNRDTTNKSNLYSRMYGLSNQGLTATGQVGNALQNQQQINTGIANTNAANAMGQASTFNNAIGSGLNYWQQQQYLNNNKPTMAQQGGYTPGGYSPNWGGMGTDF
jgi:hypothetical protein